MGGDKKGFMQNQWLFLTFLSLFLIKNPSCLVSLKKDTDNASFLLANLVAKNC